MKECLGCHKFQDLSFFYFYKGKPTGRCKQCTKSARKQYYDQNNIRVKERRAIYYEKNKESVLEKDRAYKKTPATVEKRLKRYQDNLEKHREVDRKRYRDAWVKRRLSQIKSNCKKNGVYFDLSEEWFNEQLAAQNNRCYWSNVEFDINSVLFRPSFDRIHPGGAYSKSNVVLATYFVNFGRNDATVEELAEMISKIKEA